MELQSTAESIRLLYVFRRIQIAPSELQSEDLYVNHFFCKNINYLLIV
nr:MAG TPA: hypothetical protein [Caudoviricetes sp.]